MATKTKREHPVLFIAAQSAETPDGTISIGQIAEAGAKVIQRYPLLFKPLEITYEA